MAWPRLVDLVDRFNWRPSRSVKQAVQNRDRSLFTTLAIWRGENKSENTKFKNKEIENGKSLRL